MLVSGCTPKVIPPVKKSFLDDQFLEKVSYFAKVATICTYIYIIGSILVLFIVGITQYYCPFSANSSEEEEYEEDEDIADAEAL